MKLLLDENFSPTLAEALRSLFPGTIHVNDCGLAAASDGVIWEFARHNGLVIVSKDSDFYDRAILLGSPPKLVWIRAGNCSTSDIRRLVIGAKEAIEALEGSRETALVVSGLQNRL